MINIIGAGMAGSILARLCQKEGIQFNIFDSRMPGAASQVSENLIGFNWYKGQEIQVAEALAILNSIVPVRVMGEGRQKAHHIYTSDLLIKNYVHADAVPLNERDLVATYYDNNGSREHIVKHTGATVNVICAGYWSKVIAPLPEISGTYGHGLIIGNQVEKEYIKPYKPYRFEKLINRDKEEGWYSNSLTVSPKTWTASCGRFAGILFEEAKRAGIDERNVKYAYGLRPVMESFNPHVNIKTPKGWVITGGNKSGMLYYPKQCLDMINRIKNNEL